MSDTGEWWTAPAESEDGQLVMVTGRRDVERFRSNPRFTIRVEVTWPYKPLSDGMPSEADSEVMEQVTDLLNDEFRRDPERNWVFYTLSTHIFGRKLNEVLAPLPLLPLKISAENDPGWEAYDEMADAEIKLD